MVNFTNLRHTATAVVGALVVSSAFIAAAVGPAAAAGQSHTAYAAAHIPASAQATA